MKSGLLLPLELVAALLLLGAVANSPAQSSRGEPGAKPASMEEAIARLVSLRQESPGRYHNLLRDAAKLVEPSFEGRDWQEAQALISRKSFRSIRSIENDHFVEIESLVKKKAAVFPGGHALDLCLSISAAVEKSEGGTRRIGKLSYGSAVFLSSANVPFARVVKEQWYPKGTVLNSVINSPEIVEAGRKWPLLKEIKVSYGLFDNRHWDFNPHGFFVDVVFSATPDGEVAQTSIDLKVESGLDPYQSRDGQLAADKRFASVDSLGAVDSRGGHEWWKGDEKTVRENQKKYLK